MMMSYDNTEELARLIGVLRPAPAGWVEAAQQLPRLRAELAHLVARSEQDAALRARLIDDLESALAESGIEPTPRALAEARRRLGT